MAKNPSPSERRVMLPGVSWQQFETLLGELGTSRTARLTYDRDKLEMMTPLEEHDRCNRLIETLLLVVAEEADIPLYCNGSLLLKRADLGRAIQPEGCYSVGSSIAIEKRAELDLERVAPPELVVDVAVSSGSLDRLSLYGAMGVPEIWRYTTTVGDDVLKGSLQIYRSQGDRYVESTNSGLFPFLPGAQVLEFLEQSDAIGLAQALIVLRDWINQHV
ncbi:MAG: Uma2 family endonuclease [Myxacorys californica WJT36-NPBG1]|nr:Uma2 family endonuclease [Myxacorys californica WJT36-NPBG1]